MRAAHARTWYSSQLGKQGDRNDRKLAPWNNQGDSGEPALEPGALLTFSLATSFFPATNPDVPVGVSWLMAVVASVLYLASILLHELGHSWEAQRHGMPVTGITLFIFGGVAQIGGRSRSAMAEFRVAVAGPIVSVALAITSQGIHRPPTCTSHTAHYVWLELAHEA
jgi:hypothetical protein